MVFFGSVGKIIPSLGFRGYLHLESPALHNIGHLAPTKPLSTSLMVLRPSASALWAPPAGRSGLKANNH